MTNLLICSMLGVAIAGNGFFIFLYTLEKAKKEKAYRGLDEGAQCIENFRASIQRLNEALVSVNVTLNLVKKVVQPDSNIPKYKVLWADKVVAKRMAETEDTTSIVNLAEIPQEIPPFIEKKLTEAEIKAVDDSFKIKPIGYNTQRIRVLAGKIQGSSKSIISRLPQIVEGGTLDLSNTTAEHESKENSFDNYIEDRRLL